MIKNKNSNIAENFKMIQLSNEKFRRIHQNNAYFLTFLTDIGFTMTEGGESPDGMDKKYKFLKAEEAQEVTPGVPAKGNYKAIAYVFDQLKQ